MYKGDANTPCCDNVQSSEQYASTIKVDDANMNILGIVTKTMTKGDIFYVRIAGV